MVSDTLAAALRSKVPLEREVAAMRVAETGEEGATLLATVALDQQALSEARVTALRYLPAGASTAPVLAQLLQDRLAVLRTIALEKAGEAGMASLRPLVEALTRDSAIVHDLDDEIAVADVARGVLAKLPR